MLDGARERRPPSMIDAGRPGFAGMAPSGGGDVDENSRADEVCVRPLVSKFQGCVSTITDTRRPARKCSCSRRRRESHPHLDDVRPRGPALVGQRDFVRRHRALLLVELRAPVRAAWRPDAL